MVVQVLGQQGLLLFTALNKSLAAQKKTVASVLQRVQKRTLFEQPGLIGAAAVCCSKLFIKPNLAPPSSTEDQLNNAEETNVQYLHSQYRCITAAVVIGG